MCVLCLWVSWVKWHSQVSMLLRQWRNTLGKFQSSSLLKISGNPPFNLSDGHSITFNKSFSFFFSLMGWILPSCLPLHCICLRSSVVKGQSDSFFSLFSFKSLGMPEENSRPWEHTAKFIANLKLPFLYSSNRGDNNAGHLLHRDKRTTFWRCFSSHLDRMFLIKIGRVTFKSCKEYTVWMNLLFVAGRSFLPSNRKETRWESLAERLVL